MRETLSLLIIDQAQSTKQVRWTGLRSEPKRGSGGMRLLKCYREWPLADSTDLRNVQLADSVIIVNKAHHAVPSQRRDTRSSE